MNVKLSGKETEILLSDLCIKLGFCLPPPLIKRIANNPPVNIDRFADVVYNGEGLEPALESPLYHQVRNMIAEAFAKHEQEKNRQSV